MNDNEKLYFDPPLSWWDRVGDLQMIGGVKEVEHILEPLLHVYSKFLHSNNLKIAPIPAFNTH